MRLLQLSLEEYSEFVHDELDWISTTEGNGWVAHVGRHAGFIGEIVVVVRPDGALLITQDVFRAKGGTA